MNSDRAGWLLLILPAILFGVWFGYHIFGFSSSNPSHCWGTVTSPQGNFKGVINFTGTPSHSESVFDVGSHNHRGTVINCTR